MHDDLLQPRAQGLYCPAGDFFIDPQWPVERAVVTHAHGDHARIGNAGYHVAATGSALMRQRLGEQAIIETHEYGEAFTLGDVRVSMHPSGHMLGAAQIRMEHGGRVVVVSGDYKREPDPTCLPYEPVPCDVFVTESTFGWPVYRWPPMDEVIADLLAWWDDCARRGVPALLFCYALGKAQRVLAELKAVAGSLASEPVYLHGAVDSLTSLYRQSGADMMQTVPATTEKKTDYRGALVIAPPSAAGTPWTRRFGEHSAGFCSGWMRVRGDRRRRGYDRGFVISDHADWPSLLETCLATRAKQVLLTHGYSDALARYLNEKGVNAGALATSFGDEE